MPPLPDPSSADLRLTAGTRSRKFKNSMRITPSIRRSALSGVALLSLLASCGPPKEAAQRPFAMGFTSYPYDIDPADTAAVDYTYDKIAANGDLIAFHFDSGIPWNEALEGRVGSAADCSGIRADIARKKASIKPGVKVYVGLSALDSSRTALALYRDDAGDVKPLPAPWSGYGFGSADLLSAYENYCAYLIDELHPDYFNYGIEGNSGNWPPAPDPKFQDYLGFCARVYAYLRARYPGLKLLVSCIADGKAASEANARALLAYSDYIGLSIYPFTYLDPVIPVFGASYGNADPGAYPSDWLTRTLALAPGKRIAVCETGMIAENLDLTATPFPILKFGNEAWQADYVEKLLGQCAALDAEFVVWWEIRDYDAGWRWLKSIGLKDPLLAIWKDTGLIDGGGRSRSSLAVWKRWLGKPRVAAAP
jgi:hypothetical protein